MRKRRRTATPPMIAPMRVQSVTLFHSLAGCSVSVPTVEAGGAGMFTNTTLLMFPLFPNSSKANRPT